MSRFSTKKISTLALLTSAIFTVTSLAPIEFAPGPLSPDATFAKSENGKGGGKSGNKGGNGGGRGGDKSTANGSKSGSKSGGRSVGKGVGGMLAKATKKGGNLINSVLGRGKAKTKAKKPGATTLAVVGTKPHPKLGQYGIHPRDAKGFNALFNANYHAWENAIKTGNSSKFSLGLDWLSASNTAAIATQAHADALADPLISGLIGGPDPIKAATDQKAVLQADYDALSGPLTTYNDAVATLDADLAAGTITNTAYNSALTALDAAFTTDYGKSPTDAATVVDTYEAWDTVLTTYDATQQTQADMKTAFNNVTPNVTYSEELSDAFKQAIYDDPAVATVIDDYVATQTAAATTQTAAAAAQTAPVTGAAAATDTTAVGPVLDDVVLLKTGDGETIALVVE